MAIAKALFSKASDQWETPKPLFDLLNSVFNFHLDPCARPNIESQKRIDTKVKYTMDDNGLNKDWINYSTFVNPPYSQVNKWVDKCIEEFDKRVETANVTEHKPSPIVLLVPARTDTKWWHKIANHPYTKVVFLKGRLKFNNTKNSAPFPSCIIILSNSSYINQLADELPFADQLSMLAAWNLQL